MRFSTFAALAALSSVVLGSPTPLATLNTMDGEKVANGYVVQVSPPLVADMLLSLILYILYS
jgi:hypothetical protein